MAKIKKVIIPVAGLGTRFLPATKAQPKEMITIIDKPLIQYIVEEAVASGITDVILVTGETKRAIEDHFDRNEELEKVLRGKGKSSMASAMKKIATMANFIYIRQKGPYGNGTPVMNCKRIIGNEPFAVLWGDDLFIGKEPRLKQLIDVYEKYQDPVITSVKIDDQGTEKYGVVDGTEVEPSVLQVKTIVEKPGPKKAPSRIGAFGGYILTPDIFPILEKTKLGKGNELWLVDAIFTLAKKRPIYAKLVDAKYYDIGSPLGWLKANINLALKHPEIKTELRKFIKKELRGRS
ncbi:MAG: UTP--glucose-1-phosphate uridylyltransferase [Candidatus Buchananbacteria bacterium CG10_big_fil_rev_8_21_14_0_10_42_9]|uniref:UTP--glucose-1-phosphate uridylyltransferase n=1 Tax=Candidatus Buchananbacteria bacterium CG10_big_fil_rev_8_21_14_0_10_42_9 TaxID=1974526 RepID=A0A2H0W0K0_9BACT|nr:MAG: UTP--glucose-1-phosphate uridylyltransferase [Candidatus Buchananbacteria bacterium CG10_big_fil_rev_8_21_14_0_10_42_9]